MRPKAMLKGKRYIVLFVIAFGISFVQQNDPKPVVIKSKYDFFTVDNLGNIFTIREDELVKYLPSGKFFARYSNLKLGNITTVDATNPLKLVVYYRDYQTIVFLDNQLSLNSDVVSLQEMNYEQTDLVCAGANNSFWIYDKQNNELIRFNENSKKIAATGNLKQILRTELNPNYMLEHNNYLYLNCPQTGIYVFDIFGAFSKIISIKDLKQFQVNDNLIYYQKDSVFCSYDHKIFEEVCTFVSGNKVVKGMKYNNKKLYKGYMDSVTVSLN
ncbi:MAG: hypothetical protein PSX36_05325 [bacterium]|nr:hypothetical protein [bacterium]